MITNLLRGRLLLAINKLLQRQLSHIQQEILNMIKTYKSVEILSVMNDIIGEVVAYSLSKIIRLVKSLQVYSEAQQ